MNKSLQIAQLKAEIARLERENRTLRRALRNSSAHARRIQQSYEDALQLAVHHIGGQSTSRERGINALGLTQRRWERAIALLRMAKLHTGYRWQKHDLLAIENGLKITRQQAIDAPKAYREGLPVYLQ